MTGKRYKQLGKYIELVQERNKGAANANLMGVSIAKKFIPSIANIIGTDLSSYRIVHPGNFAFCPVTSRNGDKITIARYRGKEDCIISQAYLTFRVKDENELDPEYLMMWVARPEFDRYARFHSHGSVREIFSWEEMCNVYMPIPDIGEQRKIVAEYKSIEKSIENNNHLIKVLEDTAKAIYHHTFVEGIDPENLPEEWMWGKLSGIAKVNMGQSPEGECLNMNGNGKIFYQGRTDFGVRFPDIRVYTTETKKYASVYDILMSVRAPVGDLNITRKACAIGRGIAAITPKKGQSFVFYTLLNQTMQFKKSNDEGTIFGSIGKDELNDLKVLVPKENLIAEFNGKVEKIDDCIDSVDEENNILHKIKNLLLSKLS